MRDEPIPRLEPITPPQWDDEMLDALGAFPSGLQFVQQHWAESGDARGANTLGFLAHYPALARAFLTFNKHVAIDCSLPARERELAILRISWLTKSEYEYSQHVVLGRRAGLSDADIARVGQGPGASGLDMADAQLLRAVDELHAGSALGEETWAGLASRYDHRQIMDLIFVVGCYALLAWAINTFRIPLEDCNEPLDAAARAHFR